MTLIDASSQVIGTYSAVKSKSHDFLIEQWETSECDGIGAHARRMTNRNIGKLSGCLRTTTCIFMEHGHVTSGRVTLPVYTGYIKYIISLHDIMRCGVCDKVKFVEVKINVAGAGAIEPTAHIRESSNSIAWGFVSQYKTYGK